MSTNIYLVEDHALLRNTLAEFFNWWPDFHVSGTAATAREALTELPTVEADIVLVNVSLPDKTGVELVSELHTRYPHLPCLMLASSEESFYLQPALTAGARGFIVKGTPDEFPIAIRQVLDGKIYLSRQLGNAVSSASEYTGN